MNTDSNSGYSKSTFSLRQMMLWVVLIAAFTKVFLTVGVVGFWVNILLLAMFFAGYGVGKLLAPLPIWIIIPIVLIVLLMQPGLGNHRTPPSIDEFPVLLLSATPAKAHIIHKRGWYDHASPLVVTYSWLSFGLGFAFCLLKQARLARQLRLSESAAAIESEDNKPQTCDYTHD